MQPQSSDTPSCILPRDASTGAGGLYHGGYRAVMNIDFLHKEGVTHVVNTAKGLDITYGRNYTRLVECAKQELNLVYLELNWEDVLSYNIQEEDLVKCVQFIHQARSNGGSVLVHCAHGKSRSTTAIVAYLMAASGGQTFSESLKFVQERRRMANPNSTFTKRLQDFDRSSALRKLRKELSV